MADPARTTAAAVVISLGTLLLTAPSPTVAVAELTAAGTGPDPTGPLVAAVALLAWAVTAWLSLTVTLVRLSRLPGALGRAVHVLAGRVAPAAVRRAVEAALGLTVAVGVVVPTTALAAPLPSPTTSSAAGVDDDGWDLDWPGRTGTPAARPSGTSSPVAAASVPVRSPGSTPTPSSTDAPVRPAPVRPAPVRATPPRAARPSPVAPAPPAPDLLVVRPGDSLWSLAEAALRTAGTTRPTDRQVAQAWPRWWAANREAVGDDPDLLLPGTVLRPPADPGSP